MKDPLIVANWKMNPSSFREAEDLFTKEDYEGVVVCPPFVFLDRLNKIKKNANLGAQNCSLKEEGSFTGEISPTMLKDVGCKYVILGHSERKKMFNETSDIVKEKIKSSLNKGLVPIVCIGEIDNKEGEKEIEEQLRSTIDSSFKELVIAYEPLFAIGTGIPCSPDVAKKRKEFIKKILSDIFDKNVNFPILYGGSVNLENAKDYIFLSGFEGLLIGKSSLDSKEFAGILKKVGLEDK